MRVAVKDANVFIDMELMGLFDLWASLGIETLTTSMIVLELENGNHQEALAYIETDHIAVVEPDMAEVEALWDALKGGLSIQDVSVLYVALQRDALLLTGDKKLRLNAELLEVQCHGSIWMLEQLIEYGGLSGKVAAEKLLNLVDRDSEYPRYLPRSIVDECVRRWRRKL